MPVPVPVLVIAGSGRGAGKTAIGCALIAASPALRWIAVKISPHPHETPGAESILDETDRVSGKDTSRYLRAGAAKAFLISGAHDLAAETVLDLTPLWTGHDALLVESNRFEPRLAWQGPPMVCLAVLAGTEAAWKPSLRHCLAATDALVLTGGLLPEQLSPELRRKRIFPLPEKKWVSPELLAFVGQRFHSGSMGIRQAGSA